MRRIAAVALLALACGAPRVSRGVGPAAATPPAFDDSERGNLLNIAFGASVVSRTGELTLEQSALRAIDGDPLTTWTSPPFDGPQQVLVFALPARTRVESIGIQTPPAPIFRVLSAQIDASLDGVSYSSLMPIKTRQTADVQLFPVAPPRDAVYIRLTTIDAPGRFARINSLQVRGRWEEKPKQPPIGGCWTINGRPAQFREDRGRVTGVIGGDHPISFDGGTDGLVYRFVWVRGPDRGFGAIGLAPDGRHLSGLRWYEEPREYSSAESWFGEPAACGEMPKSQDVPVQFLRWKRRLPLFGLRFDDREILVESDSAAELDLLANFARQPSSQRLRLVSREYRQTNPEENRRVAQARLDSLRSALQKRGIDARRFDWESLGSDNPPAKIETEIQRNLYSAIELEAQ